MDEKGALVRLSFAGERWEAGFAYTPRMLLPRKIVSCGRDGGYLRHFMRDEPDERAERHSTKVRSCLRFVRRLLKITPEYVRSVVRATTFRDKLLRSTKPRADAGRDERALPYVRAVRAMRCRFWSWTGMTDTDRTRPKRKQ